jgi:hypothetical protein
MSTRKLIIAALVCGMVILLAGAIQFIQIARTHNNNQVPPSVTTTTAR